MAIGATSVGVTIANVNCQWNSQRLIRNMRCHHRQTTAGVQALCRALRTGFATHFATEWHNLLSSFGQLFPRYPGGQIPAQPIGAFSRFIPGSGFILFWKLCDINFQGSGPNNYGGYGTNSWSSYGL